MEKKTLQEQTTEQLKATYKAHTAIIVIESLLLLAFLAYFLYNHLNGTWNHGYVFVIIPVVLIGGMIPAFIMRQAIVKELDLRKE